MLDDLIMERPLIGEAMFFCINHADAAEDVRLVLFLRETFFASLNMPSFMFPRWWTA